jgi:hypothetical protein
MMTVSKYIEINLLQIEAESQPLTMQARDVLYNMSRVFTILINLITHRAGWMGGRVLL